MEEIFYDVIVVGAGHAGCEAALAASRMKATTALITMNQHTIGKMSCNPSIGGMAKSHIIYELDALGGEIGRNTDFTGIQYRTLNTRKGPAVQATRIQNDKKKYASRMQHILKNEPHLHIIEAEVDKIWIEGGKLRGIITRCLNNVKGKTVIIASGTFLAGKIHIGNMHIPGGRSGENAANNLSQSLRGLGFRMGRLKTGTPPRIKKESLDLNQMKIQPGEKPPPFFSRKAMNMEGMFHVEHRSDPGMPWIPGEHQLPCYLTETTPQTHEIISKNLSKSALYSGGIDATGVRYCPSIEDKIVKFSERNSHQVFIEPEGRNTSTMYPAGTSNSLPEEVQIEMIRSIPGMSRAEFIKPGYAIEYDFCDPTQLFHTLETQNIENLYFAGQINGTTGYEEAASQGFMAGVNAVLKIRNQDPFILQRQEGYIGVLIDDLTTKGTDEPYRMFTSRAEYRLLLRQDNAFLRLKDQAKKIGILSSNYLNKLDKIEQKICKEINRLNLEFLDGISLAKHLKRPKMKYKLLPGNNSSIFSKEEIQQIELNIKYDGYINKELEKISKLEGMEKTKIPKNICYDEISALRYEAREKLKKILPETLGQATRISGVNPPDISILSIWVKRYKVMSASSALD